ncbi:MAG: ABC-2 transporter permease [Oscillospiraceae bacterium]|nr:ABC-2 transporter permease [Oscillospiraceae bacterium]
MNKTLSFVRLDFITVKPYLTLKNLIIFVGAAVFMILTNYGASSSIGILMVLAALYASYPFALGEKSNIDVLYATLSIKRKIVVLGRYLFALTLDISSGLFAYIISFVLLTALQRNFNSIETLVTVFVLFLLFSIIQAIQLPIYFKLGYMKAKLLAYLPFFALPLVIMLFSNFSKDFFAIEWVVGLLEWFAANLAVTALVGVVVWLVIMALSYRVSLSFYSKRDF